MNDVFEWVAPLLSASRLAELGLAGFVVLAVAGGALAGLSVRASAAQRHAVLNVALAALLLLPAMEVVLPQWEAGPPIAVAPIAVDPLVVTMPVTGLAMPEPAASLESTTLESAELESTRAELATGPLDTKRRESADHAAGARVESVPPVDRRTVAAGTTDVRFGVPWTWIIAALWLLGGLVTAMAYGITVAARFLHFRRGWTEVVEPEWLEAYEDARGQMGVRRSVRLRWGPQARVPVTWGVFRPVVVLPEVARGWGSDQRRAALLHELAHVARGDHASQTLAQVACVLHWFNPLAWWAAARLREEAERASDDRAAQAVQSPTDYAYELVRVARLLKGKPMRFVAGIAMARSSELESRIDAILDPDRRRAPVSRRLTLAVVLGAMLLTAPIAALSPRLVDAQAPTAEQVTGDRVDSARVEPVDRPVVSISERKTLMEQDVPASGSSPVSPESGPRLAGADLATQEAPCIPGVDGNRSITESMQSRSGRREVFWETNLCTLRIEMEGVRFTDDERSIETIEAGGLFTMEQEGLGPNRELRVRPSSSGLAFDYRVEGDAAPFGSDAQEWLAELIPTVFRVTGLQMEERMDRLMASGGTAAVFDEVRQINSDHIAGKYLGALMGSEDLTDREVATLFSVARSTIESDHALGQLLRAAWRPDLSRAARSEYIAAAGTLESDHELGQVIKSLLEASLADDEGSLVLELASTVSSDHELSGILVALLDVLGPAALRDDVFFEVANSIGSDHELGQVLRQTFEQGRLEAEQINSVLELSHTIESDHEQSTILLGLIEATDGQLADTELFMEAVGHLESDYEMGNVLKRYVMAEGLSEGALLGVLEAADELDSDYERAEVLHRVLAEQWPFTNAVQSRFIESAESIDSDHERDRTLAELARRASR